MRVWVRSEYAAELAVVFAWLGVLVPWNVTFSALPRVGSVLFVRFPLGQVRYVFGIPFARAVKLDTAYSAWQYQAGTSMATAYAIWLVGAALVALALLLSFAMYADETRVEPYRPVAVMGILLFGAGVALAVATISLYTRGFPGLPVPVGVPLLCAFGVVLLFAART